MIYEDHQQVVMIKMSAVGEEQWQSEQMKFRKRLLEAVGGRSETASLYHIPKKTLEYYILRTEV